MTHTAVAGSVRKVWRREERERLSLPLYSLGEEIFSAVSHGAAALFGVAALVVLLVACRKTPVTVASVSVFGATMILLYTVSTLYHALNVNRAKRVFRVLDHCTIYLLIAGTYTPITLCCLGGTAGLVLLCAVWGAGVLGIVLNAGSLERFKAVSMVCYIAMGWAVVFAMGTVLEKMPAAGLWFLLAGGIAYTVGVAAYGFGKKIPYMHAVWHLLPDQHQQPQEPPDAGRDSAPQQAGQHLRQPHQAGA